MVFFIQNMAIMLQVMLSKTTITEKCFSCKVTVQTIDYFYFLNLYNALKQALWLIIHTCKPSLRFLVCS